MITKIVVGICIAHILIEYAGPFLLTLAFVLLAGVES